MAFVIEREKAAPYVPEPYSTGTGAGGSIGLQIYLCQAVVLDNQTVLKDVAFAVSGIPVNVPEELAGEPGTGHAYVPELLANGPLASYFSAAGFPVTDATIIATEEMGLDVTVTVDGSTWYRALGAGRYGEENPVTAVLRHHHADGNRVVWFDAERNYQAVSIGDRIRLEATAGVLSDVSTVPGELVGTSSAGYVNATFRFGEAT